MKPDKVICNYCSKEIDKGKWCSDRCRMAFKRDGSKGEQAKQATNTPNTNKPEQKQGEHVPERIPELTRTDRTFYDRAIRDFKGDPYYRFTELRKGKCGFCSKPFETRLSLNRYCSYKHYSESLSAIKS